MLSIKVTPRQSEWVSLSIKSMIKENINTKPYSDSDIPYIENQTLKLSRYKLINEDLLRRLDTVAHDTIHSKHDGLKAELLYQPIQNLVDTLERLGFRNPDRTKHCK
tara:strand:+ start:1802 stop:2122 length:321 start_codon:yes stop_codon:yes gene_type:complete